MELLCLTDVDLSSFAPMRRGMTYEENFEMSKAQTWGNGAGVGVREEVGYRDA